ncbi:hypothetical protein [Aminipila terrae]|uniref:Uncharacterized protein n=1 Tax=Aminipila terrae TaxID=2697030 RepID=A0A6P1M8U9_9FIRM|nr:hypothetical protein [Aminipila terrae]QHI71030.1 hypothetical protein Ami3637_00300 [Aminipila terrae]
MLLIINLLIILCIFVTVLIVGIIYFVLKIMTKNKPKRATILKIILFTILIFIMVVVYSFENIDPCALLASKKCDFEDFKNSTEVLTWIDKCKKEPTKVYALCYRKSLYTTNFLIYRPSIGMDSSLKLHAPRWYGGGYLEMRFREEDTLDKSNRNYELINVNYSSSRKNAGLKVFINNRIVDCEITEIKFLPICHSWGYIE